MPTTFNGVDLLITLPAGQNEVDVFDDIYEPWKDWLLSSAVNRRFPQAFRSDGGAPLSSIINQGSYIFLNNTAGWRIKPPEEDLTIYLTGNLAVEDTTLEAFVPTTGAFTSAILGLQPITQGVTEVMAEQLLHGSFNGGVWLDVANGGTIASIGEEAGTQRYPVNSAAEARSIAIERGFGTVFVIDDATIDAGLDYTNFSFVGQGQNLSTLTVSAAATVLNSTFLDATLTGTLDGDSKIDGCIIDSLTFVSGVIENCILNPSTITLGGNDVAHFIDCESGVPGLSTPVIDCGGSGQDLAMRGYSGGIKLTNKTGTDSISIDLVAGQVRIDISTVTNGTIVVRGPGKVVNDATGDWLPSGTYGSMTLVNETVHGQMLQDIWKYLNLNPNDAMEINSDQARTVSGDIIVDVAASSILTDGKRFTRQ